MNIEGYKHKSKIAAVINFFIPGLGYIYGQKRETFGWIILTSTILFAVYSLNKPQLVTNLTFMLASLALSIAFAYDIYTEMNNQNITNSKTKNKTNKK